MRKNIEKAIVSGFIAVFVMSLMVGLVQPVSAASTKKAPIHINNTGGDALSYYQVNLNITYDSDMSNSFSDLRVKNETAGTFIPYWIEDKSDGNWCNLWFNATGIPASGWCNDTYYLYYGDAGASSGSNITNTFLFGDDFEGGVNSEWAKNTSNPILSPSASGWDSYAVEQPFVFKDIDTYYLFYEGLAASGSAYNIGYATSSSIDGPWTKHGDYVFGVGENGQWDDYGVGQPNIIKIDTTFYLFYGAHDGTKWTGIGYATSTDLNNWTRYSNNPIITNNASWSNDICATPSVIEEGGTYYVFYEGCCDWILGVATSTDLINWTDHGKVLEKGASGDYDQNGVANPEIVKNGSMFYLFHYAVNSADHRRPAFAENSDITNHSGWTKKGVALETTTGEWDSNWILAPSVRIYENNKWYMFYQGSTGTTEFDFGYATSSVINTVCSDGEIDTDKWTITNSSGWSVNNSGELKGTNTAGRLTSKTSFSDGVIQEIKGKVVSGATSGYMVGGFFLSTSNGFGFLNHYVSQNYYINDSSVVATGANVEQNVYFLSQIKVKSSTAIDFYIKRYSNMSEYSSDTDISNTVSNEPIVLGKRYDDTGGGQSYEAYWDWALVRKYASSEPTALLGTEQSTGEGSCTTPVISDLTNSTAGTTNVTITWSTNQSADNRVKYSKNSDLSNEEWSSWDNDTSSISIGLSSLDSGTPYYYQAWSYNGTNSSCSITEPVSSPYKTFTTQSTGGGTYEITLLSGWNIIGWTDTTTRTAHYVGTDIGSNCTYVSERNKTSGNYVNHNMGGPEGDDNFATERGWGYYVYLTDETVWNRTA